MHDRAVTIFGHSEILQDDKNLAKNIENNLTNLIENFDVGIVYFGGFGEFDDLCYDVVTYLRNTKYPFLKRVYVVEDSKFVNRPHKRPKWLNYDEYDDFVWFDMRYSGFYQRIYFRNCETIEHSEKITNFNKFCHKKLLTTHFILLLLTKEEKYFIIKEEVDMKVIVSKQESDMDVSTKQYLCGPCSNYGGCR